MRQLFFFIYFIRAPFRSAQGLEGYLITSGSIYPLTAFTFRQEPIGGPEGSELIRQV
jgi:hypothetical protein